MMKPKRIVFSLKYKLLLLLTCIPVVSLAMYIGLATKLFENDKIAYVKDSSVAVARSLAIQFRVEVNSFVESIKPLVESYDRAEGKFSETSVEIFERQERIDGLIVLKKNENGTYVRIGQLSKRNKMADEFINHRGFENQFRTEAIRDGLVVSGISISDMHVVVATVLGELTDSEHVIVIGFYRANELTSAFNTANIYEHFLISRTSEVKLGPEKSKVNPEVFKIVNKNNLPEGAVDIEGAEPKIVSYAETGINGLRVTAVVSKKQALAAVSVLLLQSLMFFIGLIATTVIISVIASIKLTSALRELYDATKKISKGQFDIRIDSSSTDEVGGLAEGFNFMAGEVSRLLLEAGDKARMASELETVKIVQETLFPQNVMEYEKFTVVGHFEPASECGGDWWNYSRQGDKLLLWIGDATGHGAPAAMVTSAAKSAATIIEDLPVMGPGKMMEVMNKAIHETSKGRILMTFFIASVDMKSGLVTYANASHEAPYVIKKGDLGKPLTKKHLTPLVDASGPRLGDKRSAKYNEGTYQLAPGEALLFYTDGVLDIKNKSGQTLGERRFIKQICDSSSNSEKAQDKVAKLKLSFNEYREGEELIDDVTIMICQYGEAA